MFKLSITRWMVFASGYASAKVTATWANSKPERSGVAKVKCRPAFGSTAQKTLAVPQRSYSRSFRNQRSPSPESSRKLKSGEYRLYSRKLDPKTDRRRNPGTFDTHLSLFHNQVPPCVLERVAYAASQASMAQSNFPVPGTHCRRSLCSQPA